MGWQPISVPPNGYSRKCSAKAFGREMNKPTWSRRLPCNARSQFSIDCSDLILGQCKVTGHGVFSCSVLGSMAGAAKVPFLRQKY
jgi:hypothetical protein